MKWGDDMHYYKPKDIAKELRISTSALRHYESMGVVPSPERNEKGYRLYTNIHLAYFRCLRAMFPAYGYPVTYDVIRRIQKREVHEALWLLSAEQVKLQQEKTIADDTLALLENPELDSIKDKRLKAHMTIGEVAELSGVESSAIRHWEKEGLITPERNPENGYRLYSPSHVRQILLICSLRRTVYYLESIKEIIQAVEHQSFEQAKKLVREALSVIDQRILQQFNGIHKLMELCMELGLLDFNDPALLKPILTFNPDGR